MSKNVSKNILTELDREDKNYLEWKEVCKAFCKKIGAELLFVNTDNFGYEDKEGNLIHMYADELAEYLKSMGEDLKEAYVEKKNNVDIEELAREIMSLIELYDEDKMNSGDDVFAGTEDAYAEEVFEQNLYSALLYSGLFQIESLQQEIENPTEEGSKLDSLYNGIVQIVEYGDAFKGKTENLVNYLNSVLKESINEAVDEHKYTLSNCIEQIKAIDDPKGFYDKVREIIGYNDEEWNNYYGWEDHEIKRLQREADARYAELASTLDESADTNIKAESLDRLEEAIETKAGNNFDEVASYMYNEANGDIDYIPSFEQTNDYIASVTKREYNELYKEVKKAIENVANNMYNGYIELSDRATMNSLYGDRLEDADPEEAMWLFNEIRDEAFKQFEEETKTEIWQDGRSGRHIIVKDNYSNAKDYGYLCRVQERLEDWAIAEFARRMSNDNLEEAVKPNQSYIDFLKKNLGDTYQEEETDNYLIIRGKREDKPIAALWYGRAQRPQIYSSFRSEEDREKYIQNFLNNKASDEEAKAKRKEERKLTRDHDIKVGDIFYTSWGYDQTNIDFYEVVNVRGSRIDLKEIGHRYLERGDGGYPDLIEPVPGSYINDNIITVSARVDGTVTSISSFEYPSRWDGKPKYQTNPYSGH